MAHACPSAPHLPLHKSATAASPVVQNNLTLIFRLPNHHNPRPYRPAWGPCGRGCACPSARLDLAAYTASRGQAAVAEGSGGQAEGALPASSGACRASGSQGSCPAALIAGKVTARQACAPRGYTAGLLWRHGGLIQTDRLLAGEPGCPSQAAMLVWLLRCTEDAWLQAAV